MERCALALWFLLIGLGLGLLGNVFFYQKALGLSFPLFIGIAVLVTLAASRPAQTPLRLRNLWPLIPLLFFASMVAVRSNLSLMLLNILGTLTLAALTLHYLPLKRNLDEGSLYEHLSALIETGLFAIFAALPEVSHAWEWLRGRSWQGRTVVAVGRGLIIAVPVLLVFTVLLGSADAIFEGYINQVLDLFNPNPQLIDQLLITGGIAGVATGTLAYGLARRAAPAEPEAVFVYGDEEMVQMESLRPEKPKRGLFHLGMIEAGLVLGLVDLLFGVFVIVQLRYFFGGQDLITDSGLSYATYARRGFFELVAVSVLTLGLVLWLNHSTARQSGRENRIFIGLAVVVVALTSVMLVSAAQRMYLYEQVYGFTHLRVMTHVFMVWLGLLFGFFVLSLFEIKPQIFALGVLLTSSGYLVTLNLMNLDLYIAERNIERFYVGEALDLSFLGRLSVDALPAVLALYEDASLSAEARDWAAQWLAWKRAELNAVPDETVFSLNLTRQNALATLNAQADLPSQYDPYLFYQSSYDIYYRD